MEKDKKELLDDNKHLIDILEEAQQNLHVTLTTCKVAYAHFCRDEVAEGLAVLINSSEFCKKAVNLLTGKP